MEMEGSSCNTVVAPEGTKSNDTVAFKPSMASLPETASVAAISEAPLETKLKTPATSARVFGSGRTRWTGTPRHTANFPYPKPFPAVMSQKVAGVLKEADTAMSEARFQLKVKELRRADEEIKRLLSQSLADKEKELETLRAEVERLTEELKSEKAKSEEFERDHAALQEKLAFLAGNHTSLLESATEKERLPLKEQQAVSNQRIMDQDRSLVTMTEIRNITRRGLDLARNMRRTHSLERPSADVSGLKESLLIRSAVLGVWEESGGIAGEAGVSEGVKAFSGVEAAEGGEEGSGGVKADSGTHRASPERVKADLEGIGAGSEGVKAASEGVEAGLGAVRDVSEGVNAGPQKVNANVPLDPGNGSHSGPEKEDSAEEFGSEASLIYILASSDVLESATVHDSPLFSPDPETRRGVGRPQERAPFSTRECAAEGEEGFVLELPLRGELSFDSEESGSAEKAGTEKVRMREGGETDQSAFRVEETTKTKPAEISVYGEKIPEGLYATRGNGEDKRRASLKGRRTASLTISQWAPQTEALTSAERSAPQTSEKGKPGLAEGHVTASPRRPLASIQNLAAQTRSNSTKSRKPSDPKYAPSPDVENQKPVTQRVKGGQKLGLVLPSGFDSPRYPSPQYSPKRPSMADTLFSSQASSPRGLESPNPLIERQFDPAKSFPIVAPVAENSPVPSNLRLSQSFAKQFDSPSRFQKLESALLGGGTITPKASPPTARRLLVDTPVGKEVAKPNRTPKRVSSPYMGWPMPSLGELTPLPDSIPPVKSPFPALDTTVRASPILSHASSARLSFGVQPPQLLSAKDPFTPNALLARAGSLGGSPYFADLVTPAREEPPSATAPLSLGATSDHPAVGERFGWDLKVPAMDSLLPGLPLLPKPFFDFLGSPTRTHNDQEVAEQEGLGWGFGAEGRRRPAPAPEGPRCGFWEPPEESPARVHGFEASRSTPIAPAWKNESALLERGRKATKSEEGSGAESPPKGLLGDQDGAFGQVGETFTAGGPVRRTRKQGRLSKELGRTHVTTPKTPDNPSPHSEAQDSALASKKRIRNVTLKDITSQRRVSADSAGPNPKTPEVVDFAPVSPPSATPEINPVVADSTERSEGVCSVLIVLEEAKKDGARRSRKTANPVIGCVQVTKTTTLAELRPRLKRELGAACPERFVFLQAGIGATWHSFSGDIEGMVTALTLPVADGPYQQHADEATAAAVHTSSATVSPTRHAVRLAVLRPLPTKRTLHSLTAVEGPSGIRRNGDDERKDGTRRGLAGKPADGGLRSSTQGKASVVPGPWAAKLSLAKVSSAGLSVRLTDGRGLRESAIADAARRESRESRLRSRER